MHIRQLNQANTRLVFGYPSTIAGQCRFENSFSRKFVIFVRSSSNLVPTPFGYPSPRHWCVALLFRNQFFNRNFVILDFSSYFSPSSDSPPMKNDSYGWNWLPEVTPITKYEYSVTVVCPSVDITCCSTVAWMRQHASWTRCRLSSLNVCHTPTIRRWCKYAGCNLTSPPPQSALSVSLYWVSASDLGCSMMSGSARGCHWIRCFNTWFVLSQAFFVHRQQPLTNQHMRTQQWLNAPFKVWLQCGRNFGKSSRSQLLQRVIKPYIVVTERQPSITEHSVNELLDVSVGVCSGFVSMTEEVFFQVTCAHDGRCTREV
jgi:hypothetical protein